MKLTTLLLYSYIVLICLPVQAQLYTPEIKVVQTANNDIIIGSGPQNSILKVENDMYIKYHKKIRFPGGSNGVNKIYADQTGSGWRNWRFVSHYDNLVFNAGENSGRNMIFQIGGQDAMSIHWDSRNVGIGTTPLQTGERLRIGGEAISNGWKTYSDINLKKNVTAFNGGLAIVKGVNPICFNYDESKFAGKDKQNERIHIGVSAQELQAVAPFLVGKTVTETGEEYLTVDNSGLDFVLLGAIKEQQIIIEQLQVEIINLRKELLEIKATKK